MDQLKLNCCGLGGHADCGPVGLAQSSPLGSFVGADGIAEPGESVVDEACLQNPGDFACRRLATEGFAQTEVCGVFQAGQITGEVMDVDLCHDFVLQQVCRVANAGLPRGATTS